MSSDKEILALEDKRYAAMCGGDFAALEAMLHDELPLYPFLRAHRHPGDVACLPALGKDEVQERDL
jgi:hypothetical protein